MMAQFLLKELKTDITAVKATKHVIFIGVGRHLLIISKSENKLLRRITIFKTDAIYGIQFQYCNKLLVYGGNKLKIFKYNNISYNLEDENYVTIEDWILAAKWLDYGTHIAVVSMHNIVTIFTESLVKIKNYTCSEKCILYSAFICCDDVKSIIILSGTVFSEVLIWRPVPAADALCPVLYRLIGHKGVIFSVYCSRDLRFVCSTSDDRSAILWSTATKDLVSEVQQPQIQVNLACQVYGHSARIFRCIILKDCFITSGEDSVVNVWNFQGHILRKIEAHQGGAIWALDYDVETDYLVTGGADCSVNLFKLKQNYNTTVSPVTLQGGIIPKQLSILSSGNMVVLSEEGLLFSYILSKNQWNFVDNLKTLQPYALLNISDCRKQLAFTGGNGNICIYKEIKQSVECINTFCLNVARIFALHWLTCNILLTCGPDGVLKMWLRQDTKLKLITKLILPHSKERWSTAACLTNTKNLIVGDRKGNIYLFCLGIQNPIQTIRKAHSHLGITFLVSEEDKLFSLGRNGMLRIFQLDVLSQKLSLMSSDKVPFSWLAKLIKIDEKLFLLGFSGNEFIIWDYNCRKTLLNYSCGGGHRSWDLLKKGSTLHFIYIKNKTLSLFNCEWNNICPKYVLDSFHSMEVNCIEVLMPKTSNQCLLISGGEDTTLQLTKMDVNGEDQVLTKISVFKSHLSSIRAVHSSKISERILSNSIIEHYLIFTAGGRAQIILWNLAIETIDNVIQNVTCSEKYSYYEQLQKEESETRIMDLTSVKIDNYVVLFTACSDGKVKIYIINLQETSNMKLVLNHILSYKLRCIIKICNFCICRCNILTTMATDGKINFWNVTSIIDSIRDSNFKYSKNLVPTFLDLQPFYFIKAHQSGINSYSYKILNNHNCIFFTGGDDNALVLHFLNFESLSGTDVHTTILNKYFDVSSHSAQVTGVNVTDEYLITTSIDQKVLIFKWIFQNNQFTCDLIGKYSSSVADIHGMQIIKNTYLNAIVYGKGIEVLQIK